MEQPLFDGKSVVGAVCSFFFAYIGTFTVQDWASVVAIATGLTTMAYTVRKMFVEKRKK